jgi:hypothetical protein
MRCAHCKESGPSITVDHVRNCDGQVTWADKRAMDQHANDGPMWPASDKQVNYVMLLQNERQLPDGYTVKTEDDFRAMERDQVSGEINLLKTLARKHGRANDPTTYTMPEGRYALYMEAGPGVGTGSWHFYEVDKPTKGRWDGYVFIKRLIGAPGHYNKVAVPAADRHRLLDRIETDPQKAMVDYGKESGVCGRCASPLSDPESLARGIGPKCAAKSGWF